MTNKHHKPQYHKLTAAQKQRRRERLQRLGKALLWLMPETAIIMSAQQLFDDHLNNFNATAFKETLTVERLTSILEHMCKGSIAKYIHKDYVGYAFLDEHPRKV